MNLHTANLPLTFIFLKDMACHFGRPTIYFSSIATVCTFFEELALNLNIIQEYENLNLSVPFCFKLTYTLIALASKIMCSGG